MVYYLAQFEDKKLVDWVGPYLHRSSAERDCNSINTIDPIPDPLWRVVPDNTDWTTWKLDVAQDPEAIADMREKASCHCGRLIYVYHSDDFNRGLCKWCSDVRCDVPEPHLVYDCEKQIVEGIISSSNDQAVTLSWNSGLMIEFHPSKNSALIRAAGLGLREYNISEWTRTKTEDFKVE